MKQLSVLIGVLLFSTTAWSSSGPAHLISWAAQLYDQALPHVVADVYRDANPQAEGEQIIFGLASAGLLLADIRQWQRAPVAVAALEQTQNMDMQYSMEVREGLYLRIHWVEEHLNLSIESEGEHAYVFSLQGLIEIQQQEQGVLLSVKPAEPCYDLAFIDPVMQAEYFPE